MADDDPRAVRGLARLIVHGGAWSIPDSEVDNHEKGVRAAVASVWDDLRAGNISALDAYERCVRILEDDETFDAGRGAFLNDAGEIELDAMIQDGCSLKFGALGGVCCVRHPVTLARVIMEQTEHHMLVGGNADVFAKRTLSSGDLVSSPEELLTERERDLFQRIQSVDAFRKMNAAFLPRAELDRLLATSPSIAPAAIETIEKGKLSNVTASPSDTVGCVALDVEGRIAAATSTGGLPRKLAGRVGDCPIVGAGTYADNATGGCSVTGWGEAIMRVCLAKRVTDGLSFIGEPDSAHTACRKALEELERRVHGSAGVICIDSGGRYGWAFNTERMAFAFGDPETGKVVAAVAQKAI